MREGQLKFPVIVKSLIGTESPTAHSMALVFDAAAIEQLGNHVLPPYVLQEFINHNATCHKVFMVGERFAVVSRGSLRNMTPSPDNAPILFNSQEPLFKNATKAQVKPDIECITKLRDAIRHQLGLEMVGFDVIFDAVTGAPSIIDINYFPGYDGFPQYHEAVLHLCMEHMKRTQ